MFAWKVAYTLHKPGSVPNSTPYSYVVTTQTRALKELIGKVVFYESNRMGVELDDENFDFTFIEMLEFAL